MPYAPFGGAYGPLITSGFLFSIVKFLPSYRLVPAGESALDGGGWPLEVWVVIAVWTLILSFLAVRVYQRDTKRI